MPKNIFQKYDLVRTLIVCVAFICSVNYNAQGLSPFVVKKAQTLSGYFFMTTIKPTAVSTNTQFPYHNIILDNIGDAIYYKRFPGNQRICDFKIQPNGMISYFDTEKFYLMNSEFTIVDSVFCKNNFKTDNHELLILPNGNYAMLGLESYTMDLSAYNVFNHLQHAGSSTAQVISAVIQELDKNKNVVFEWHCKDHFEFMDVDTFYLSDPTKVDWTHCNALAIDKDGNYILSSRNFNEITKISRNDSSILWRLGGKKNQFTFTNDTKGFFGQHNVYRNQNGSITLFDNGREHLYIHPATAKEYTLNEKKLTATLVWSYTDNVSANSVLGFGNVQKIANGNTLVNYGKSNLSLTIFSLLSPQKKKLFEVSSKDTVRSYRVYHYLKLPFALKRPHIKSFVKDGKTILDAGANHASYRWNNGAQGKFLEVKKTGEYFVWVPVGDGGFIRSEKIVVKISNK